MAAALLLILSNNLKCVIIKLSRLCKKHFGGGWLENEPRLVLCTLRGIKDEVNGMRKRRINKILLAVFDYEVGGSRILRKILGKICIP